MHCLNAFSGEILYKLKQDSIHYGWGKSHTSLQVQIIFPSFLTWGYVHLMVTFLTQISFIEKLKHLVSICDRNRSLSSKFIFYYLNNQIYFLANLWVHVTPLNVANWNIWQVFLSWENAEIPLMWPCGCGRSSCIYELKENKVSLHATPTTDRLVLGRFGEISERFCEVW